MRNARIVLFVVMLVVGCSSGAESSESTVPATDPSPAPTSSPTSTLSPAVTPAPEAAPTPIPTSGPAPRPSAALPGVPGYGLTPAPQGTFATARPDAGTPQADGRRVISVFDEPGGEPRVLLYANDLVNTEVAFPLVTPTEFDQPLVLRVVSGSAGDDWLRVQAPIRPHRSAVWVRGRDFIVDRSTVRIEVDVGREGMMTVFEGEDQVLQVQSVYGRPGRETTLRDSYVEQVFDGSQLGPAYGAYVMTTATFSEVLPSFGGGSLPGQSIHGTNQPELVGQAISSGGIRVSDDAIEAIHELPNLVGAAVVVYDSTDGGPAAARARVVDEPWTAAPTGPVPAGLLVPPAIAYS